MAAPGPLQWAELAGPGCLVAPASHQPCCDSLLESLITRGYAVISGPKWVEEERALAAFWASSPQLKEATHPLQPVEGCGYRDLTGDRQLLEFRAGPWLCDAPVLPTLLRASEGLEAAGRQVLGAALRGKYLRLPGSALAPALDDLPLPSHAWASSSLQCFAYGSASTGCEAHVDKGLLTLIWTPGTHGLQVQNARGQWSPVPPTTPEQLVVLAGHTLEHATCGLIKAATHKVVLTPGQARRSVVYKLAANPGATLHLRPALLAAGHALAAADRYLQPASVRQVLEDFAATHRSVNATQQAQHAEGLHRNRGQGQEQAGGSQALSTGRVVPAAVAAMAAAAAVAAEAAPAAAAEAGAAGAAAAAAVAPRMPATAPTAVGATANVRATEREASRKRGRGASSRAAAAENAINISVQASDGSVVNCVVQASTQWHKVATAYCNKVGLELKDAYFLFDGNRIGPHDTIRDHNIQSGDTVDVFLVQRGD